MRILKVFLFTNKLSSRFAENILLKRILSIKYSILFYSGSSMVDLITIAIVSKIFAVLTSNNYNNNINIFFIACALIIILRTYIIYLLRKYSFSRIIKKKYDEECKIVKNFIKKRKYLEEDDQVSITTFKENLTNSSYLALMYFDIPIASISAELLFAFGGIFFLIKILGVKLILINLPLFFLLVIFSRFISKKLHILGKENLNRTEKRIKSIDNISEISFELSVLNSVEPLLENFSKINKPFNKIIFEQLKTSNCLQISIESAALSIILISIIYIIINPGNPSLANSASSLAILSRMVPSITRSIGFFASLQFGIPMVKKLAKLKLNIID